MKRLVLSVKVVEMQGGAVIGGADGVPLQHVPMYTKEVRLEPRAPTLAKLLDWVEGVPAAAPGTQVNVQINVGDALQRARAILRQA
jgi:hypothetical protein